MPRSVSDRWPRGWRAAGLIGIAFGLALLAGCSRTAKWHAIDVSGSTPALAFTMTRAADGKVVTPADYRGKVVLLYLG